MIRLRHTVRDGSLWLFRLLPRAVQTRVPRRRCPRSHWSMPEPGHATHRFRCPSMSQLHLGTDPGGRHVQPAPCSRRERAEPTILGRSSDHRRASCDGTTATRSTMTKASHSPLASPSAILHRARLFQVRSSHAFCGRRGAHDGSESLGAPVLLERGTPRATAPAIVPKMAEVETSRLLKK
jgi:hypothetical protein